MANRPEIQHIADELSAAESALNRALGKFSIIAGGSYGGSLREYRRLVRYRLGISDLRMYLQRQIEIGKRRKIKSDPPTVADSKRGEM